MDTESYLKSLSNEIGLPLGHLKELILDASCKAIQEKTGDFTLPLKFQVISTSNKEPQFFTSNVITQGDLAKKFKVSRGTISNWIKAGMPNPLTCLDQEEITEWVELNKANRASIARRKVKLKRISIQKFCSKHRISNTSYLMWRKKGMPCLKEGATEREILMWIEENKLLNLRKLAERYGVTVSIIRKWISLGMPSPKLNPSLEELDRWYEEYEEKKEFNEISYREITKKFKIGIKSLQRYIREGMPKLEDGHSIEDCEEWIFQNKMTNTQLAKILNIRPVLITKYKRYGMPTIEGGAKLYEIENWVNKHHGTHFKIYELEKIMGVCRKTISHYVSKGMPDPRLGATLELCANWEDQNFEEVDEFFKLVRISSRSYDTLIRYISKGMPDPRAGFSVDECMKWINGRSSFTELAVKWQVSLGTIKNWVRLGMPDPRKGFSEEESKSWILAHAKTHNLTIPKW